MRKNSFATRVRTALIKLGGPQGNPVTNEALADELELMYYRDKRPMYHALDDMRKTGEVVRTAPATHAYKGRPEPKPDTKARMWAVLRMRRNSTTTIDDLQELTGCARSYAQEFLSLLIKRGAVERIGPRTAPGAYRLVADPGPASPELDEKAARLRRIRDAKKIAIEHIDAAGQAFMAAVQELARARVAINDIPEEADHADE